MPPYRIAVLDLRGQDGGAVAAGLAEVREEMSHQVLPSDRWPLFDIRASLLDQHRRRLHLSVDLLIADAWSIETLARELLKLYVTPEVTLAPFALSFRDCVLAQMKLRETELYQRSLQYWQARLASLPTTELPLAVYPGELSANRFCRRESRIAADVWRRLKLRARRACLTPSAVLLTAFAEVLATWSKDPHFTINLTLFQRLPLHPQINDIVGDFTSLSLLEINLKSQESFEPHAQRAQEQLWQDLDHQYVSGVHVLRGAGKTAGGATWALMPIVFTSLITQTTLEEVPVSGAAPPATRKT